jgi:hypothetical protein
VERRIQPGLTRFNWNSLGIGEYCKDCRKVLKNLTCLVAQVEKIGQEMRAKIDYLEKFDFFCFEKCREGSGRLSCKVNTVIPQAVYRNLSIGLSWLLALI